MRLIKEKTSIDFLSSTRRKIAMALSVVLVVVSLASLFTRGLEFGIDLWEHVANVIEAMRGIAPDLGLAGEPPNN